MKGTQWLKKSGEVLEKYKYVLLCVLAGVLLLVWPGGDKAAPATPAAVAEAPDPFDTREVEEWMADTLSYIEGAGRVRVLLSVAQSPRQVLAQDGSADVAGDNSRRETSTVIVAKGTGQQEPAVLQVLAAEYRGAVVVSPGGDDPQVRLALSQAVSALTGLGADKIAVVKWGAAEPSTGTLANSNQIFREENES